MKYAIIALLAIIIIFVFIIIYLKKISSNNENFFDISVATQNTSTIDNTNKNPGFLVTLLNYKKHQLNIYKSKINDIVTFKKQKDKRIKVYNNSNCIGLIAIKDYKDFNLIAKHTNYFEGRIANFEKENNTLQKVTLKIQVKKECSKKVYLINPDYFSTLINMHCLFEIGEIINSSYGPSTIVEIFDDHLIVDVPSLGNREIYNIKDILI